MWFKLDKIDDVICPGCGLITRIDKLDNGACPDCGYENGSDPWRLLTLSEMLNDYDNGYNDVNMRDFLRSLLSTLNIEVG